MDKLSEAQINHFNKKGWLEPLDTFSVREVDFVKQEMDKVSQIEWVGEEKIRNFYNPHLGITTPLNHHLYCQALSRLFADKRVTSRLKQLGEPNLLLWRTNIFHRMPGCGLLGEEGIGWHYAIDNYGYDADEAKKELVFPEEETLLNLTVWIALEDITSEMGTLAFASGSHQRQFTKIKGSNRENEDDKNSERKQDSQLRDFDENEWEIESLTTIKAGQIVIFTEQVVHRGLPNRSNRERYAVNGRYIRPSVLVYPQRFTGDYIDYYGFDIRKHFCILVSGQDNHGINEVVARS